MNPPNTFRAGKRLREWGSKDLLPLSGKLIPEFDRRRNIRDMFKRKPTLPIARGADTAPVETPPASEAEPSPTKLGVAGADDEVVTPVLSSFDSVLSQKSVASELASPDKDFPKASIVKRATKRANSEASTESSKRRKSATATSPASTSITGKAQQSLKGFLKPKTPVRVQEESTEAKQDLKSSVPVALSLGDSGCATVELATVQAVSPLAPHNRPALLETETNDTPPRDNEAAEPNIDGPAAPEPTVSAAPKEAEEIIDPIVSKESWSKLFTKRPAPRCEGHDEPCISLTTKKSGMNCGRAFWMCSR